MMNMEDTSSADIMLETGMEMQWMFIPSSGWTLEVAVTQLRVFSMKIAEF